MTRKADRQLAQARRASKKRDEEYARRVGAKPAPLSKRKAKQAARPTQPPVDRAQLKQRLDAALSVWQKTGTRSAYARYLQAVEAYSGTPTVVYRTAVKRGFAG